MNRRRRRPILFATAAAAFAVLSAAQLLPAKPGVVKTRDGRALEGDVVEKPDSNVVSVTVRGITSNVNRDDVDTIVYTGDLQQQYKDKVAALTKNPTAADHLTIARWAFDNHAYDLARRETDAALAVDPNSVEATTLNTTINSQMRLEQMRAGAGSAPRTGATPPHAGTTVPPPTTTGSAAAGPGYTAAMHKYLAGDDINALRLSEWTPADNSVHVTFANDVKRKYIASQSENAAAFNALPPVEQARKILTNGTPDLAKDVKIVNDPVQFAEFKRTIQPMVITGCATAACHGGPAGGKFFLYGTPENDAATYTNFYLLTKASASVAGAKAMMVDRVYPDASLLALWGLPVEISKTAHPEVKGVTWRTMFRSKQDAGYQTLIKWINKLQNPEPRYPFTFSLDGSDAPATQPITPGAETGVVPAKVGTPAPPPAKAPVPVTPRVPPTDVPKAAGATPKQ